MILRKFLMINKIVEVGQVLHFSNIATYYGVFPQKRRGIPPIGDQGPHRNSIQTTIQLRAWSNSTVSLFDVFQTTDGLLRHF